MQWCRSGRQLTRNGMALRKKQCLRMTVCQISSPDGLPVYESIHNTAPSQKPRRTKRQRRRQSRHRRRASQSGSTAEGTDRRHRTRRNRSSAIRPQGASMKNDLIRLPTPIPIFIYCFKFSGRLCTLRWQRCDAPFLLFGRRKWRYRCGRYRNRRFRNDEVSQRVLTTKVKLQGFIDASFPNGKKSSHRRHSGFLTHSAFARTGLALNTFSLRSVASMRRSR